MGSNNLLAACFTIAATEVESPGSWSFLMMNNAAVEDSKFGLALIRRYEQYDQSIIKSFTTILPFSHGFSTGKIPVGISLKIISEKIDDGGWHYGLSFDTGVLYTADNGVSFGLSKLNVAGSDLRAYNSESWFGMSWTSKTSPVAFAVQSGFERPFDFSYLSKHFSTGMNYKLYESGLRFGNLDHSWEIQGGYFRIDSDRWWTVGIESINMDSDTYIGYSLTVNSDGWKKRVHFITYGYNVRSGKSPSPRIRRFP